VTARGLRRKHWPAGVGRPGVSTLSGSDTARLQVRCGGAAGQIVPSSSQAVISRQGGRLSRLGDQLWSGWREAAWQALEHPFRPMQPPRGSCRHNLRARTPGHQTLAGHFDGEAHARTARWGPSSLANTSKQIAGPGSVADRRVRSLRGQGADCHPRRVRSLRTPAPRRPGLSGPGSPRLTVERRKLS